MYLYRVPKYKGPQIYLKDPQRIQVPIVINHYRHSKPATVNKTTGNARLLKNKDRNVKYENATRGNALCRWVRERRALKRLNRQLKIFQLEEILQAQQQREAEIIKKILKQEEKKIVTTTIQRAEVQTQNPNPAPKVKVKKAREVKATFAKPKAESKAVTVTKYICRRPFSERFLNCFYRTCCQFFCCLSIILVLCVAMILLI